MLHRPLNNAGPELSRDRRARGVGGPAASALPAAPSDLLERFPELADVEVRDVTITGATATFPGGSTADPDPVAPRSSGCTAARSSGATRFPGSPLGLARHRSTRLRRALARLPQVAARRALPRAVRRHPRRMAVGDCSTPMNGAPRPTTCTSAAPARVETSSPASPSACAMVPVHCRRRSCSCIRSSIPSSPLPTGSGREARHDDAGRLLDVDGREMNLQYAGSEEALDDPYAFAPNGESAASRPCSSSTPTSTPPASGEAYADALRGRGSTYGGTELDTGHGHLNEADHPGAARSLERIAAWLRDHARPNA